jgi:hypothetical protein
MGLLDDFPNDWFRLTRSPMPDSSTDFGAGNTANSASAAPRWWPQSPPMSLAGPGFARTDRVPDDGLGYLRAPVSTPHTGMAPGFPVQSSMDRAPIQQANIIPVCTFVPPAQAHKGLDFRTCNYHCFDGSAGFPYSTTNPYDFNCPGIIPLPFGR